jgi:hypothetical protein
MENHFTDEQIRQQNHAAPKPETQAASFTEEPICRLIMKRMNEGQFKSIETSLCIFPKER